MKQKLLKGLLLGLACIGVLTFLLPKRVSAAPPSSIFVNGFDIISDADHTIQCGKGTAVYDPTTGVLTLVSAQIYTPDSLGCGIYSDGDLSIILDGNTSISNCINGIKAAGDITIKDITNGGLSILGDVNDGNGINSSNGSIDIKLKGDINLSSTSTCISAQDSIYLTCNKLDIYATKYDSVGISCRNSISISTVSDISVRAGYKGISSNDGAINIECSQGAINVECRQIGVIGLNSVVTISSFSNIHISSTETPSRQYTHAGISAEILQIESLNGSIYISGNHSPAISTYGNISALAEEGSFECGGIWVSDGTISIAAKDAVISSDTYGVQTHTHISICGKVTITGGIQALYPHLNEASGEIVIAEVPGSIRKIITADNTTGNNAQEYTGPISLLDNSIYKYIRVSYTTPVKAMVLNKSNLSMLEGSSDELVPMFTPADATNHKVTWSSSNSSIVLIDNGKVTALKPGNAIITATSEDGNITASCAITVTSNTSPTPISPAPTVPSVPDTGDTNSYWLYILLFSASALIIIYPLVRRSLKH